MVSRSFSLSSSPSPSPYRVNVATKFEPLLIVNVVSNPSSFEGWNPKFNWRAADMLYSTSFIPFSNGLHPCSEPLRAKLWYLLKIEEVTSYMKNSETSGVFWSCTVHSLNNGREFSIWSVLELKTSSRT